MEWPCVRLNDIAEEFISGGTPSTKVEHYWNGSIPWITGADVEDKVVVDGRKWITQDAVENSATHIVPRGAILLVTRTGVGKVARAGTDIAISQDLTGIVLKEGINVDFIVAAIRQKTNSLLGIQQGAIIKGVLRKDIEKLEIPLPPLSEQRRIINLLDQADRLRRLRAEADAKAARILPALFIKMFGDPATNPMGWKTAPIGDAIVDTQYGTSKRANADGKGVPILRMNNISAAGEIDIEDMKFVVLDRDELERQVLQRGDILFNRTNSIDLVGKTGLWEEGELQAVAASYLIRVRVDVDKLLPPYVWAMMQTTFMKSMLASRARRAVGMANINATELRRLPAMFPPLELQEEFAALSASIRQLNKNRRGSIITNERLSRNLLDRAFSGPHTTSRREVQIREFIQETGR